MPRHRLLNFNHPAPDLTLLDTAGKPVTLSKLWKKRPLLLAFTRHFGCTQCKEMLEEIVQGRGRIEAAGLGIAVITQGTPETADLFAREFAPDLLVLADPERKAYQAYGLERGTLFETFLNLKVMRAVARSRKKGYEVEPPPPGQDAMQMSGSFIISRAGRILLPYYYDNIADHPPLDLWLNGVLSTRWDQDFDGPVVPCQEISNHFYGEFQMKKRITPIILAAIIILAISACAPKAAAADEAPASAPAETIIAEGRLLPVSSLDLSFSVPGQVAEVLVKEGDRVRAGQVLARLVDSPEAQSALAGAEKEALAARQALDDYKAAADVNLAQGQLNAILAKKKLTTARDNYYAGKSTESAARMDEAAGNLKIAEDALKQLEENAGLDPDQINTLEARLGAANAAVESAREAVDALELKAAMPGTAADIRILPGQRITAGEVVMAVADFTQWVVKTDNLTEVEVVTVKEGQEVEILLDALPDVALKGVVSNINARYEEKRGDITYTVTAVLNETNPLMRWGMTAAVRFAP